MIGCESPVLQGVIQVSMHYINNSKIMCRLVAEQVSYIKLSAHLLCGLPLGLFPSSSPVKSFFIVLSSFISFFSSTPPVFSLLHLEYLPGPASTLYPHLLSCLYTLLTPSTLFNTLIVWLGFLTLVCIN